MKAKTKIPLILSALRAFALSAVFAVALIALAHAEGPEATRDLERLRAPGWLEGFRNPYRLIGSGGFVPQTEEDYASADRWWAYAAIRANRAILPPEMGNDLDRGADPLDIMADAIRRGQHNRNRYLGNLLSRMEERRSRIPQRGWAAEMLQQVVSNPVEMGLLLGAGVGGAGLVYRVAAGCAPLLIWRYFVLVAIVIGAISAWKWGIGVPFGWKSSPLGISPFGWAWLVMGLALFALMGTIYCQRKRWMDGCDAVILGGHINSHDMGNSHFPLWFLRWQGHSWFSFPCSILIFLFPFFVAGHVWWTLNWEDLGNFGDYGKVGGLLWLLSKMCKWFAYWQPLRKEDAFKRADPTNRENGDPTRSNSFARLVFLVLAALQGHEKTKRDLKTMLCQGGLDEPTKRDSDG